MSGQKPRKKAKVGGDASTAVPASRSNPARSSTRPRALFIAVYNFKGGCGKTFVTRELAATAAKGGRRVGMVDADPQCNLTSWWLPSSDPYMGVGADSTRRHLEDAEEPDKDSGHHWVGPAEHVNQGDIAVQQVSNRRLIHVTAFPKHTYSRRVFSSSPQESEPCKVVFPWASVLIDFAWVLAVHASHTSRASQHRRLP